MAINLHGFEEFKLDKETSDGFNWQDFLLTHKYETLFFLLGVILLGFGAFFAKKQENVVSQGIEVLENATENDDALEIIVEISGAVETPGVYKLPKDSRVEDALIAAGGLSANADREWMEKAVNRAAKISDGQKIYIPRVGEQNNVASANSGGGEQTISPSFGGQGSGLININTASQKELESLKGIGPVYGANIIEHRPYSNLEELVSKGAIGASLFEKIKDKITVF